MKKFVLVFVLLLAVPALLLYGAEKKKELRITFAATNYIDPAVGSDFASSSSLLNLYDPLVYPTKTGDIKAHLAESWTASKDGKTWTFKLRKGVKFHDGSEVTAEDVAFSMSRFMTVGEGRAYLFIGRVKSAEAVDKYTVRFNMEKPYGPFLTTLVNFYILNKKVVMDNIKPDGPYGELGDYGKEYLITHDAGSGPYKVKEMRLEEYLLMEKFGGYWGKFAPGAPDEVKFIGTTEPMTIKTMMSRQELEISDQWQSTEALKSLDAIQGVDIATIFNGTMFYYMMHTKKAPTDDVHFRKALSWAMDYKAVADNLFPGSRIAQGPVPPGYPGHWDGFTKYTLNKAKALEELKQSKYYGKLDEYPVELHWISEVPDEEKAALLFMSKMAEIGVKVNVVKVPWLSVVDEMAKEDTSPNIVTVFVAPHYAEAGSILDSRYHSRSAPTWEQNEWLLDTQIDALLDKSIATIGREERFKLYKDIQKRIDELAPSLYLFEQAQKHAYQASYIDWPAARGESVPVMGYDFAARFIQVYPEKRK